MTRRAGIIPPDIERCSCDESLALRAELARLEARVAQTEALNDALLHRARTLEARLGARPAPAASSSASSPQRTPTNARTRLGWSSRHRGVYWHAASARWRARAFVDGRRVSLGAYLFEHEAAAAVAMLERTRRPRP
jgi:hypothetical protein